MPATTAVEWGVPEAFGSCSRSCGTVKAEREIDQATTAAGLSIDFLDQLGNDVEGVGDLIGDGVADLCVGAPGRQESGDQLGSVYVLSLTSSGNIQSFTTISISDPNAAIGSGVGALGDLDDDGMLELAVGQVGTRVWIVAEDSAGVAQSLHLPDPSTGSMLVNPNATNAFGYAVTVLGDLHGGDVIDLAVGDFLDDDGGEDAGAVHLFRLSDGDPEAAFTLGNTLGCAPLSVTFSNASTGSGALSYQWDFGHGSSSTQQDPTHTYTVPGTYSVTLTEAAS